MNTRNRATPLTRRAASLGAMTLALLLSCGVRAAHAGDWNWTVTPYAWATDIGVDAELDGRQVVDETIPVGDLLQDLNMILQGRIEARNGAHGVMLDLFYASLSDEVGGLPLPKGAGQADLESDMGMAIVDVAGFYDPKGDQRGLSFLYGARIIHETATVDATFRLAPGGTVADQYETSETLLDVLVGMRFSKPLTRRLSYQMQADVSKGGTDLTWSAYPALTYAFGTGRQALTAGYRTMTIDFADEVGLDPEMTLSGPVFGYRMSF